MIREYKERDLSEILDVWYSASQIAHLFLTEEFFEQERRDISTIYLPNAETWVYELDEVVIGFIALIGNEVGAIFVDPAFHGQGVGCELMDKASGLRNTLELDVFEENLIGRRFYRRYGFSKVNEYLHEETGYKMLRLRLNR